MSEGIDIVIPWVDGGDPAHRARRVAAMGGGVAQLPDDVGGETRYASMGELRWVLGSVNRFAPWARRVFVVTDRQTPLAELRWVEERFERRVPVEIVDHSVIFRGAEELLPVFNSLSIETMVWRIPGLSERYIYFNDDMFLMSETGEDEWFEGDRIVCHGHRFNLRLAEAIQWLRPKRGGVKPQGFKTPMIASAKELGMGHFIFYYHSPVAQSRSLLEEYFSVNGESLLRNASFKFRDMSQFQPQSLCLMLAERSGRLKLVKEKTNLFLKPTAKRPGYLLKRLARADGDRRLTTGCINSLDQTTAEERARFEEWICGRLNVEK